MSSRQVAIKRRTNPRALSTREPIATMELAARQVQFQALEKAAAFRRVSVVVNWRDVAGKTSAKVICRLNDENTADLNMTRIHWNFDESLFHQETWGSYS